jgi:uroporphyrinogen decarboxylase
MSEYTGRKRISAAFKKTFSDADPPLDRLPAYIFTGQCNAQLIGATMRQFLQDTDVFVKAQVAAYNRYKPDILIMMRDLVMNVEAVGSELSFPENGMCAPKADLLEDKGKLNTLKVPDPKADGRLPGYLEALVETKKVITDAIVSAVIGGPWTIATGLRGLANSLRDTRRDPDFLQELMAFSTQATIAFTEAISELGVGVGLSEAPASCDVISPKIYQDFIFPYHKEIVDHFKAKKVGVGLHVCGNANPILDELVSTGASNVSVDAGTDLAKAVEACRGKAVLIGNLAPLLFLTDEKEEMAKAMQDCLDVAPADSGYILAPGCEVPLNAPPEKIDWFMELADELAVVS